MEKCLETVLNWINRISISIDKPYINFSFVKATPALVLCVSYFIILVTVCCYEVTRGKIRLHILSKKYWTDVPTTSCVENAFITASKVIVQSSSVAENSKQKGRNIISEIKTDKRTFFYKSGSRNEVREI